MTARTSPSTGLPLHANRSRVSRYDTIIVGGGQAGLAVSYQLTRRGVDHVVLDAGDSVGSSWRERWDSLRLFTPARYSGLPGMPFPDDPTSLPDKDQVADYLMQYAGRFDLPVRLGTRVTALRTDGNRFVLETTGGIFEASNVVVATGPFQTPKIPAIASEIGPDIHQIHSSQYRSPFDLPAGEVLVVGAGNSGAQIALELSNLRAVTLAGRDVGRLPRTILGADVFHWIWPVFRRLNVSTWLGRTLRDRMASGDSLVGIGPADFAAHGVKRAGKVTEVRAGVPHVDGAPVSAKVIIWATGFASDYRWIALPVLDASGDPRHTRGVADLAGLYFVGLKFQHTRTSALIGGVGEDAAFIADAIVARS